MPKTIMKLKLLAIAPFLVAGCVTTSGGGSTAVATMATQGSIAQNITSVTAAQISAVANGGVDWSGQGGPFPTTISGGDGFQANPTNDASFGVLINAVRSVSGAPELTYNAQLDAAAQGHSNDMFANGVLTHTGSNGSTIGQRATAAGYVWTNIGENIARGQQNENLAMNGWISSPGHQANNTNPAFRDFGLARTGTGASTYWTLVLGAQ